MYLGLEKKRIFPVFRIIIFYFSSQYWNCNLFIYHCYSHLSLL